MIFAKSKTTKYGIAFLLIFSLMITLLPANVSAVGTYTTYNESATNSQATPDVIPLGYGAADEHHYYGTISSASDSDWYTVQPLRHGRVFVMVLCENIFYSVSVYKGNTTNEIYTNTPASYDCIADISFVVTRDSVNNADMPTYYINIRPYNGSYSETQQYRLIVFYARYDSALIQSAMTFPLPLSGSSPEPNLRITSSVGQRTYDLSYHVGTDIGASYGTTLYSVGDAYVDVARKHSTYGNRVFLTLDVVDPYNVSNQITVRYYHLSSIAIGEEIRISKGDVIGAVGYDGLPSISHTHLHIDFNSMPTSNDSRFLQSTLQSNPTHIINIVDLFPYLGYWANNSGYIYIND